MSIDSIRRALKGFSDDPDWLSIKQKDGTTYRFHRDDSWKAFGLYWLTVTPLDAYQEERPPTPPLLKALAGAVDRAERIRVMDAMFPQWRRNPPSCAFHIPRLIEEGVLEPNLWAAAVMAEDDDDAW